MEEWYERQVSGGVVMAEGHVLIEACREAEKWTKAAGERNYKRQYRGRREMAGLGG